MAFEDPKNPTEDFELIDLGDNEIDGYDTGFAYKGHHGLLVETAGKGDDEGTKIVLVKFLGSEIATPISISGVILHNPTEYRRKAIEEALPIHEARMKESVRLI